MLIWFALQCSKAKQCTVSCGYDHMPVSRGNMRAQYPLLMAHTHAHAREGNNKEQKNPCQSLLLPSKSKGKCLLAIFSATVARVKEIHQVMLFISKLKQLDYGEMCQAMKKQRRQ